MYQGESKRNSYTAEEQRAEQDLRRRTLVIVQGFLLWVQEEGALLGRGRVWVVLCFDWQA